MILTRLKMKFLHILKILSLSRRRKTRNTINVKFGKLHIPFHFCVNLISGKEEKITLHLSVKARQKNVLAMTYKFRQRKTFTKFSPALRFLNMPPIEKQGSWHAKTVCGK